MPFAQPSKRKNRLWRFWCGATAPALTLGCSSRPARTLPGQRPPWRTLALNPSIVSLEDGMKGKTLISALALIAALPKVAWAATVTGRITYLDLNMHRLMLDNSD